MSQDSSFLKNTLDLIESDPEVKSYIYQQILDFNTFVTPETLVMVIARDPKAQYKEFADETSSHQDTTDEGLEIEFDSSLELTESIHNESFSEFENKNFRIAIILKENEHAIEAEAFDDDIFQAIYLAKEKLIKKLIKIQEEVESPQDRINAIQQAYENKSIH